MSLHPQRGGDPNAKVVRSPSETLQFDNGLKALARLMKGRGKESCKSSGSARSNVTEISYSLDYLT